MSLAVVRCPACRGASRVLPDAIGQMVGCPLCQTPFVAEEDIPVVQPVSRSAPPAPVVPVAPRRRRPLPPDDESEPTFAPNVPEVSDPEHDPHSRPVAGLPVSVLVGLALLPFGIPLLWRVAPLLTGQEAALSLAVPLSLAIAASALCLGVVYTIDWTASTRIKGVLMLVGLAYLSAAGLFFLKKDLMDRVRALGGDPNAWNPVSLNQGNCKVRMPGQAWEDNDQPLQGLVTMSEARRALVAPDAQDGQQYSYRIALSKADLRANRPDDAWFARVGSALKDAAGGKPVGEPRQLRHQERPDAPGREWAFEVGDAGVVRVVQVYVIKGRVYYLCAEGPKLKPGVAEYDEYGAPFFKSFFVEIK